MAKIFTVLGAVFVVLAVVSEFVEGEVTKDTPITVKDSTSPVIVSQTKIGSPSDLSKKFFYGLKKTNYALKNSPVYRSKYYMHRTELEIPDERAVRLNWVKEELTDDKGMDCLMAADEYVVHSPSMDGNVSSIHTKLEVNWIKVSEQNSTQNYTVITFDKDQKDSLGKAIKLTTIVKYKVALKTNKTCTKIQSEMVGTIVRMYDTNPDASQATNTKNSGLFLVVLGILYLVLLI